MDARGYKLLNNFYYGSPILCTNSKISLTKTFYKPIIFKQTCQQNCSLGMPWYKKIKVRFNFCMFRFGSQPKNILHHSKLDMSGRPRPQVSPDPLPPSLPPTHGLPPWVIIDRPGQLYIMSNIHCRTNIEKMLKIQIF
jgi:hypothetical protein